MCNWKIFGFSPDEFINCKLFMEQAHSDHSEEENHDHDHEHEFEMPWYEYLVIDEENLLYICFNMFVTILCLFSVYYYGSMAGFRYLEDSTHNKTTTIILESIFFLHMLL